MKKKALFVFNGEEMCFVHVLLNAVNQNEKGYEVRVIIEGASCGLLKGYADGEGQFQPLFNKCMELNLINCVCKACAIKMKATVAAEKLGIPFSGEMSGHPSMSLYMEEGFDIITF